MAKTKPIMRFIATTKDKVDTIRKIAGQLIFVTDDRTIYLDTNDNKRTIYQSIISVINESTREAIESPVEGFYYVREDNSLWSYFNSTWGVIIGENANVVFPDNGLPETGVKKTLYVDNATLYCWNSDLNQYEIVKGRIDWEEL